jgi:hypothetical protein
MSEAAEYRALADECLGWAKTARGDRERRIFLQMTEAWLEAAALAEKKWLRGSHRTDPPNGKLQQGELGLQPPDSPRSMSRL